MILIKNTNIIDGTGKPPFKGDILIKDDRISAIGSFPNMKAETIIDGFGLTVVPGFIDPSATSDHYLSLFSNPSQKDFLLQGVTTIIGGQCGSSLAPLLYGSLKSIRKWTATDLININWSSVAELKNTLNRLRLGINFATLAGHSTMRRDLIGEEIRDLTVSELEVFKNSLSQAMKDGALGLSTGLGYNHSRAVSYSEIKNLLGAVSKNKGVYATHLRNEKEGIIDSVKETIAMSEETGVPAIISHFRPIINFEKQFKEALALIDAHLNKGNVFFQVNPFNTSIVPIYTLLPVWAKNGPLESMMETIASDLHRPKILEELSSSGIEFDKLIIAEARDNQYIIGKTLKEFSESRGLDAHNGLLALMEITGMKSLLFYRNINSAVLLETLFHQRSLIGSNSASLLESQLALKPERSANTFPEFFKIVSSRNIPLEEAVKKITLIPAKIFGLQKRGAIADGWFADLVMLKDGQAVNVIVNGQFAVQDGKLTGKLAGLAI